jgi:glutathione S-transferase
MTLTFATANREGLARLTPQELAAELARSPDRKRSEIKRQVITHGLEAPLVVDAVHQHRKLLDGIETAIKNGPYLTGQRWSLADAAVTPYVWRLDKLKLARMWDDRPGVLAWYNRVLKPRRHRTLRSCD